MYICYILFSTSSGRYYVGSTQDLANRFTEHNSGENQSTRPGAPWEVVWTDEFISRHDAIVRERQIKSRGIRRYLEGLSKPQPGERVAPEAPRSGVRRGANGAPSLVLTFVRTGIPPPRDILTRDPLMHRSSGSPPVIRLRVLLSPLGRSFIGTKELLLSK